jgi:hypothetical protein
MLAKLNAELALPGCLSGHTGGWNRTFPDISRHLEMKRDE